MLDNIKWIFFDIGSTLVDETKAYRHRIEDAINGTDITYQEFYDRMIGYYRQNLKGDKEAIKYYGLKHTKWHIEDEVLFPETKSCLERLRQKYNLGVIANQALGLKERLEDWGILKCFNVVVSSAEEGIAKPDLEIFSCALSRAKCAPHEAIMVGDRLDNDIVPANQIGMKTVWIKQGFGKYQIPVTQEEEANYSIVNINELCSILGSEKGE